MRFAHSAEEIHRSHGDPCPVSRTVKALLPTLFLANKGAKAMGRDIGFFGFFGLRMQPQARPRTPGSLEAAG